MNWGFNPQNSVDELYYGIYNFWHQEPDTYQDYPIFKPDDEDILQYLENAIVNMCDAIIDSWQGDFENNDYCEEIITGERVFPIVVYYKNEIIPTPIISVDYDPQEIWETLLYKFLRKLAKEIMKSITKDNLQDFIKERREFIKDKSLHRYTITILRLTDSMIDDYMQMSFTVFNTEL